MNGIKVHYDNGTIEICKSFAKRAENPDTKEYKDLQRVVKSYPEFIISVRTIKKNVQKKTYHGLTYAYMERYIRKHEVGKRLEELLAELEEMLFIAECHSKRYRYPVIKKWFLDLYPDVKNFGIEKDEEETSETLSELKTNIFTEQSESLPKAS